jgi:hypothetical protein
MRGVTSALPVAGYSRRLFLIGIARPIAAMAGRAGALPERRRRTLKPPHRQRQAGFPRHIRRGDGKTALFQGQQAGRPSLLRIRNAARGAQIPSPWPFVVHFVIEFRPPCGLCNASDRYTTANSLIHPYGIYEMFVTTWLGRGLYSCRVMHGTPYPLSSESRERRICKGHPSRALVRSGQSIRIPIRSQHRAPLQSSDTDLTRDDIHVKSDTGSCFPCLQGD